MNHKIIFALLNASLLLASCSTNAPKPAPLLAHSDSASMPPMPIACADLAKQSIPDTKITFAQRNAAANGAPEHCEIIGAINERVSSVNNQKYAIRFHLRMPTTTWNNRFLFLAQGGNDGNLGNNLGANNQINEGYATVSTDAGHESPANSVKGDGEAANFGLDPQARLDYGYNADEQVTLKAKKIINLFYAKDPSYSYLSGCSNGGRHAMVDAVRFPDYFDGIVAGNPGFNLPKSGLAEAWDEQIYASLATEKASDGKPALWTAFTPSDMDLLASAVRNQCDALDGLADGMVHNFQACRFDPAVLQCKTGKDASCLSQPQVAGIKKIFAGPKNSKGESLYATWPWDVGISAPNWRSWKLGTGANGLNNGATAGMGSVSLSYIFTTPPTQTSDPLGTMLNFNFDSGAPKIFATSGIYSTSAVDYMTASTNIAPFIARGKKLIIYHGVSDPVFSINDTIAWYGKVAAANGGIDTLKKSVRLYAVPGMNHCGGGPATSQFDALAAVVKWVEQGVAPDQIVATVPVNRPPPGAPATVAAPAPASLVPVGRTRPLCPYPQYAQYKGSGNIDDAASFVCK